MKITRLDLFSAWYVFFKGLIVTTLIFWSNCSGCQSQSNDSSSSHSSMSFALQGTSTLLYPAVGDLSTIYGGTCTGILITPNWVITAAHCVPYIIVDGGEILDGTYESAESFEVLWQDEEGQTQSESVRLDRWVKLGPIYNVEHPYLPDDVALVRLQSPMTSVEPMRLLPALPRFIIGTEVIEVGYGGPIEGAKHENTTRVKCLARGGELIFTHVGHTWPGDSGGPILLY